MSVTGPRFAATFYGRIPVALFGKYVVFHAGNIPRPFSYAANSMPDHDTVAAASLSLAANLGGR